MRLLHVRSKELRDFTGDDVPPYAILSHTWTTEEVTFADFQDSAARQKLAGWLKIEGICKLAAECGYNYVWVDTCCIDKRSSAELSEAVNSMFRWYARAKICFVYLADVAETDCSTAGAAKTFRKSRWFTRGWTLQELIAPTELVFLSCDWQRIGNRGELINFIKHATRVTADDLRYPGRASIARRMSWMAGRRTTRPEDIAYCLLGLVDVSMPLLYGEGGERAFLRLQLEVIKQSDDESIFAWSNAVSESISVLASHPEDFESCHDIFPRLVHHTSPYQMTNRGLQITLVLEKTQVQGLSRAKLNCSRWVNGTLKDMVLVLQQVHDSVFYRESCNSYEITIRRFSQPFPMKAHGQTTVWILQTALATLPAMSSGLTKEDGARKEDLRGVQDIDRTPVCGTV